MDGEPHWRQPECSIGLRSVGYCLLNFTMLSFSLFAMKRNPAGPVHSQVSKKGRRELMQRGCNLQLRRSEKSDVGRSDVSLRWPMREMVGLGKCGGTLSMQGLTSRIPLFLLC